MGCPRAARNGAASCEGASQFLAGGGCRAATTPSACRGRKRAIQTRRCAAPRGATRRSATSATAFPAPAMQETEMCPESFLNRVLEPCREKASASILRASSLRRSSRREENPPPSRLGHRNLVPSERGRLVRVFRLHRFARTRRPRSGDMGRL